MDTLNGGLGDDTYSFTLGDGNDTINEAVNATSGGTADRISILSPPIDPVTPAVITGLNANDSNTGTNNGDLVINYTCQRSRRRSRSLATSPARMPGQGSSASTSTAPPTQAICRGG